jgi:hypothetical protein
LSDRRSIGVLPLAVRRVLMIREGRFNSFFSYFSYFLTATSVLIAVLMVLAVLLALFQIAQAQNPTYTVLHSFALRETGGTHTPAWSWTKAAISCPGRKREGATYFH